MGLDGDVVPSCDVLARDLQIGQGAGDKDEVDALGRQAFGGGASDTLRGAGDQGGSSA
jgi:hypothetical protein